MVCSQLHKKGQALLLRKAARDWLLFIRVADKKCLLPYYSLLTRHKGTWHKGTGTFAAQKSQSLGAS